jgi:hypothetical protein
MDTYKKSGQEQQIFKIPKEVLWCKECVISNQRPRIIFNENGVCSGCINQKKKLNTDWSIKYNIRDAISNYITNFIKIYRVNKSKTLIQKKWIYSKSSNELFLNSDKVFYLYKCLENLMNCKKDSNK